jgi:drug/metabolite transporter (DMT)-like permease
MIPAVHGPLRIFVLTAATMVAFAGNALLCRAALRGGALDVVSFTVIRLASATLMLAAIVRVRSGPGQLARAGSWYSAVVLIVYAITFSLAFVRIGASTGALLMCGAVQLTMMTGALVRGERPTLRQWFGFATAVIGLIVVNLPSLDPPPPLGAALMLASGVTWGMYSLHGRDATQPAAANAGTFLRSLPFVAALTVVAFATSTHLTERGVIFAIASGAFATGLGYVTWYAVMPSLGAARGAIVQLSIPVIAAAGAIVLLDEPLERHVVFGGAVLLGGLGLALWRPAPRSRRASEQHAAAP